MRRLCHLLCPGLAWRRWLSPSSFSGCTPSADAEAAPATETEGDHLYMPCPGGPTSAAPISPARKGEGCPQATVAMSQVMLLGSLVRAVCHSLPAPRCMEKRVCLPLALQGVTDTWGLPSLSWGRAEVTS